MLVLRERRTTSITFWPRQLLALSSIGVPGIPILQKCNLHPSTVTWDTTWRPHCIIRRFWWLFVGQLKEPVAAENGVNAIEAKQICIPTSNPNIITPVGPQICFLLNSIAQIKDGDPGIFIVTMVSHQAHPKKTVEIPGFLSDSIGMHGKSWEFWAVLESCPHPHPWHHDSAVGGPGFSIFRGVPAWSLCREARHFKVPNLQKTDWSK